MTQCRTRAASHAFLPRSKILGRAFESFLQKPAPLSLPLLPFHINIFGRSLEFPVLSPSTSPFFSNLFSTALAHLFTTLYISFLGNGNGSWCVRARARALRRVREVLARVISESLHRAVCFGAPMRFNTTHVEPKGGDSHRTR